MSRNLYIGVDGGQSGTRAVLATETGLVLAIGNGPACDHITGEQGYARNADAIQGAIGDAVANAGHDANNVVSIGMGLTSAPREINARPVFERIVREVVHPLHLWIDHDAATNLAGASAGSPGVVVIAGSGSIAYGLNAEGMEGRAGGLGYLMGDEGSAWWIGINALQAAAAAADGRGPDTVLLPFVLEHFGVPTIRHLHGVLYAPSFERTMVSGLTVQIVQLAGTDAVARGIITAAGEKLAAMAVAAIRQIHTSGEPVNVYPTGGVFRAGDLVTRPFEAWLRTHWSTATVRQPEFEPMYGALIRAYQAAGIEVSAALLGNLRA
jgi:N-acetylglucosamine kinase-like BadF-type ATPase